MSLSPPPKAAPNATVVTISYHQLLQFQQAPEENDVNNEHGGLIDSIGQAFGSSTDCLGLIAVTDIPGFAECRERLLSMGPQLAQLPKEDLDACVRPDTLYSVGWSHGREQLSQGKPDWSKGSYYANPLTESLVQSLADREPENEAYWRKEGALHPEAYADNVWPSTTQIPHFQQAFVELGQLIKKTGVLLAAVCDAYCQKDGVDLRLEKTLRESLNAKGRLLHYFSEDGADEDLSIGAWCGWHNDHGSLTGLAPGMYCNKDGKPVDNPDPCHSGLYIQARSGQVLRAELPPSACGFQIGETSQIQSGGVLQATPHAVQPPRRTQAATGISRAAFAVFLEPEFQQPLVIPPGKTIADCQGTDSKLPQSVLPLSKRWQPGHNFGDFHQATVSGFTAD